MSTYQRPGRAKPHRWRADRSCEPILLRLYMFHRSGVPAAVDAEYLAGDVTGFLGDEECACRGDVLRLADATYRGALDVILHRAAEQVPALRTAQHGRVDETRRNRIDGDSGRSVFEGQRLGQAVHRGLRRHIVGHEWLPGVGARRRDVDDAAPSRLDHVGQHRLDGVEHAVQVHVDHPGPFLERHVGELLKALYARRVDQHQNRAERLADLRYRGVDLGAVRDIGAITGAVIGGS